MSDEPERNYQQHPKTMMSDEPERKKKKFYEKTMVSEMERASWGERV
jgi:hypothetical protein